MNRLPVVILQLSASLLKSFAFFFVPNSISLFLSFCSVLLLFFDLLLF